MHAERGWLGLPWRALLAAATGCLVVASAAVLTNTPARAARTQEARSADGTAPQPVKLPAHAAAVARVATVQGLGDSVPAAAACDCTSYVVQLAQQLGRATGRPVAAANSALNGLTSSGLLAQIGRDRIRATADRVTVVTIGANDFDESALSGPGCSTADALSCYGPALAKTQVNVDAILTALVAGIGPHGPVLVTGYWNVFLDGQVAAGKGADYVRDSDGLTRAVNAVLQAETQRHGMRYVDLYTPFKAVGGGDDTALLAPDGDHPSAAGHALITTLLRNALATRTP